MWKVTKGKKLEAAMKILKAENCDKYLKDFLNLAGQWCFLHSTAIVRLFGVTLTGQISMVMEYIRLGPLDRYLRANKKTIKLVDLIEASANLASAVWHLEDNNVVHGNIRCRKLLVSAHNENTFTIKLSDPGLHKNYESREVHWIPIECYANLDYARRSTAADVWAFATTLYEMFSYGEPFEAADHLELMKFYAGGKRLPKPPDCPKEVYLLMRECWDPDPHRRKQPQAIMRDINQLLYQVYNSRRVHSYSKVTPKSRFISTGSGSSSNSLNSNDTESTFVLPPDDLVTVSEMDDAAMLNGRLGSTNFSFGSQNFINYDDDQSCDLSNILSNLNYSTTTTSLDSLDSMQSIFELGADTNVILQGKIGQGFYGEVYRGTLEYLSSESSEFKMVAVKKLKTNSNTACLQDFEREINIMKTLKHQNIVEILGVLHEPEMTLVMEFVDHGCLQNYLNINRDKLEVKHLLKFALDIASGMEYLGTKHIVHRDLAARNILVADKTHVKISDFGLAQVMGNNDYYILKTNRELPIKWYAPESLSDGKFSVRSDVWSYGVTMCELFAYGEEPKLPDLNERTGQDHQELLCALKSGKRFPRPSGCPQDIYVRIMYPCWEEDPHKRPSFSKLCSETEDLLKQQ